MSGDISELRRLQLVELLLLLEVKRICNKYDINYFLIGGTLLGAIRHKGFIPWDDDIDIGMLREDYEHFLEVCKTELPPTCFLQTWKTDEFYVRSYSKLRLNGTNCGDRAGIISNCRPGILIDIFPCDAIPDNILVKKIHWLLISFSQALSFGKVNDKVVSQVTSRINRVGIYIGRVVSRVFSKHIICEFGDYVLGFFNQYNTKKLWNYPFYCCSRSYFMNSVDVEFEGISFKAPMGHISYLEEVYGDWETLPHEDKRITNHDFSEITFGKYEYISSVDDVLNHDLRKY